MIATVGIALAPVGAAAAAKLVKSSSGPLQASMTAPPAAPKINTKVPITVTATLNGKPAHGTAAYEFLVAGMVVAHASPAAHGNAPLPFVGQFKDKLDFPATAAGEPLTFRVVIKAGGHTVNLDSPVTPHK